MPLFDDVLQVFEIEEEVLKLGRLELDSEQQKTFDKSNELFDKNIKLFDKK